MPRTTVHQVRARRANRALAAGTPTTASEVYEQRFNAVRKQIAQLSIAMDNYDRRRSSKPSAATNWGYAGDMAAVKDQLAEALRMLGEPETN